jgi:hypothetical protein
MHVCVCIRSHVQAHTLTQLQSHIHTYIQAYTRENLDDVLVEVNDICAHVQEFVHISSGRS